MNQSFIFNTKPYQINLSLNYLFDQDIKNNQIIQKTLIFALMFASNHYQYQKLGNPK